MTFQANARPTQLTSSREQELCRPGSNASNNLSFSRWTPIPLRLLVGYGFMVHAFLKLSRGPDVFASVLQALGVPAPHLMAWVSILTELIGGLAVLLGA